MRCDSAAKDTAATKVSFLTSGVRQAAPASYRSIRLITPLLFLLALGACTQRPTAPTPAQRATIATAAIPTRTPINLPATTQVPPAIIATATRAAATPTQRTAAATPRTGTPRCPGGVDFLGYSDLLDKTTFEHTAVGGLSALV